MQSQRSANAIVLLAASLVVLALLGACGSKAPEPPPAPAAPAEPKLDRATMLRQAAARIEAEKEKKREAMRALGEAVVTRKKVVGKGDNKKLELAFEFENKGEQELVLAEGFIVFSNSAGEALKKMKVPFADGIKPGKSASKRGKFPVDKSEEGDIKFAQTPLKELQVEWRPTRYRLADGTELLGE
jgi:hypothetical protein